MSRQHKVSRCIICHQPATQTIDGEPSCSKHAQLVYENQLEDYTRAHLQDDDWTQLISAQVSKTED